MTPPVTVALAAPSSASLPPSIPPPTTTSNSTSTSHPNPSSTSSTTNPEKRPWDPSAPNILWAHQLRRENIQAANQMDSLQAILASANKTIATLHESIDILTARIGDLEEGRGEGFNTGRESGGERGDESQIEGLWERVREVEERLKGKEERGGERESEVIRALTVRVKGIEEGRKSEGERLEKGLKGIEKSALAKVEEAVQKQGTTLYLMVQSQNNEITTLSDNLDEVKEENKMLNVRVHGHDILIEDLNGKVGGLKTENGALKRRVEAQDAEMKTLIGKIDGLERENGSLKGKADLLVSTIDVLTSRVQVLENHALGVGEGSDGKASSANTTSRGGVRGGRKRSHPGDEPDQDADQDVDQEARIPNSLPTPMSRRSSRRSAQRTATETTWGSLSDLDKPCVSRSPRNVRSRRENPEEIEKSLKLVRQEGRTLQEYLSMTTDLRLCHIGTPHEHWISAFLAGLNDKQIARRLAESMENIVDHEETLAWDLMRETVRGIIKSQEVMKRESVDDIGKSSMSDKSMGKRKDTKKTRRSIPIVPLDEEDAPFVPP